MTPNNIRFDALSLVNPIKQMSRRRRSWKNYSTNFLVAGCHPRPPVRMRKETLESGNLFNGSWISASLPYLKQVIFIVIK